MTAPSSKTAIRELEALCWAAGFRELPPSAGPDPERMCHLLLDHGLAGRLLARLAGDTVPAWCTPALRQAMHEEQTAGRARWARQETAVRALIAALPANERPFVLPGEATGAVTDAAVGGDDGVAIDVLSPEPARLATTLGKLGYRRGLGPAAYDAWTRLQRDGVAINLYGPFPIYAYPAGLRGLDLTPESHPGIWLQSFSSPERHELRFSDLIPYLTDDESSEPLEGCVIRPEPRALIHCARQFHAYIQSPFVRAPALRLGVLAEIRDLLTLPVFDGSLFRELTQRWHGADAVNLAGQLLEQWCGRVPENLRSVRAGALPAVFPRCMGSCGAWVDLGPPAEALLMSSSMEAVERLGMSSVRLERAEGPWRRGPIPPAPGGLDRFIVHAGDGDFDLPALCAWRSADALSIAVRLPRLPRPGQDYGVRCDGECPEEHLEIEFDSICEELRVAGPGRVDMASDAQGHELRIHLGWKSLATLLAAGVPARILLTIARRKHRVSSFYDAEAVIVLPLRLTAVA